MPDGRKRLIPPWERGASVTQPTPPVAVEERPVIGQGVSFSDLMRRTEEILSLTPEPMATGRVTRAQPPELFTPEFQEKITKAKAYDVREARKQRLHSPQGIDYEEFQALTPQEQGELLTPFEFAIEGMHEGKVVVHAQDITKGMGPLEAMEKRLIATVNAPLFNVGGVEVTAPDIVAVGLLAYGGVQALADGIPMAYRSLMRASVNRNLNSWAKSTGRTIPKETKDFFTETIVREAKPSWLTKQAIKTMFKPTKGGKFIPTPQAQKAADTTTSAIVKTYLPEFSKTRTDEVIAGIRAGKFEGGVPTSVQAVQAGRMELGDAADDAAGMAEALSIDPVATARFQIVGKKVSLTHFISIKEGGFPDYFTLKEAEALYPRGNFERFAQKGTPKYNKVPRDVALDDLTKRFNMTPDEIADRVMQIRAERARIKELQAEAPKAEAMFGEADAGIQRAMMGVSEKEVRIAGKGKITQAGLDDQLKLAGVKEVAPTSVVPETGVTPTEAATEGIPTTVPPIPPETGITPESPSIEPSGKISFANLQDTQTVVDYSNKPDVSRWIANLPGVKQVMSKVSPSAIANTPGEKAVIARAVLREEGTQKAQGVISYLNELGNQEKIFGKLDDNGFIASGKLKGLSVNDIRTYPKKYAEKLTPEQKEWIGRAHEIEVAKLKFMRDNGIEIKELSFMEGGEYAGRRVFARMSSDGELLDSGYVGAGPTRVGKKAGFEKRRWFATAKEALDEGYKYLPDDEALALNVRAAYNRVADKKMSEWLLTQVPWRTTGAPEELVLAAESAKMRLNRSLQLSAAINRAVRGERVPDATLNSIARVYPEESAELRNLIPEIQVGKPTAKSVQALTRKAKALIKSDRADWNAAVNARARAREKAMAPGFGEAMIMHPAFSGRIFTGPEAKELADTMRKALDPQVSQALGAVNKVNALVRYFKLAGDFSPLAIQLIFLAGQNPKIYGGAAFSIPRILFDPEFQAKFLSDNKAVIDRHPGLLLSTSGTEFTEAMAKGGMLSSKINILPKQEAWLKKLGLLVPRVVGKAGATVLEPFQRVFEGTLDYAGIKMAEALEHIAKTPAEMAEVDQFINEFRGLTSSAKLGVSPNWRAAETATLLAPRYNRAIAALLSDAVKGAVTLGQSGIRNRLAIQGLTRGIAAISAIAVVISLALGEDEEEIKEHFDPNSSRFFTWNIEGTNVGPGTKVRSIIKLIAQSADNPEALFQNGMDNPLLRFIRGNLAPVLGGSVDILTGTNYIGDPVRSDVSTFTKEMIVKNFMPIWVENVVYEGGTVSQKLIRGSGEFFGGRAYPETISEQVGRLRDRYAAKEYGKEYESLNNSQRDALRQKYNDLAEMEKESKVYYAERGNPIERFYFNEKQRITDERNNGLEKAAQAYLNGEISKYDYDKQRGYIRPYYSGGSEVLWSAKESLDEYSVKQLEKWLDENEKPEDKALGDYQEYRAGLIETADLPVDWDIIERELDYYLTKYPSDIQAYIIANMNNWINDLPEAAKQVEQERESGIEDESWWDDYREVKTAPTIPRYPRLAPVTPEAGGRLIPSWKR